jgi:hypothetical protein
MATVAGGNRYSQFLRPKIARFAILVIRNMESCGGSLFPRKGPYYTKGE